MPRRANPPAPYRWLAEYYDEVFTPQRSPFQAARNKLLRDVMPQVKSACDLACGTGVTALALARNGIEVFAVDVSPAMCRLTREKVLRERRVVHVIKADMRRFRLPHPVDLITCESDAINHVPRKSDLHRVAKSVSQSLRLGGYFLFDVNNSQGFKRYWKGNVWLEKAGVVAVMRNGHSRSADRAWSDVEWFIREGNHWQRHQERVEEICWTREEIRQSLNDAGFEKLRAWDATRFFRSNSVVTRGCHTIYLARKAW